MKEVPVLTMEQIADLTPEELKEAAKKFSRGDELEVPYFVQLRFGRELMLIKPGILNLGKIP
jgi:hypothetical protein